MVCSFKFQFRLSYLIARSFFIDSSAGNDIFSQKINVDFSSEIAVLRVLQCPQVNRF